MKVLRGTLTFVLGMIIGIILFVLAIGGAVVALGTAFKVGELQEKFVGEEVISSESNLYDQTVLDAVKSVIDDVQNIDTLSLKTLYEHYGISALQGVGGIDFSNKDFYNTPLTTLFDDFSIIVNSFTLKDISDLTGNDFTSYGLPVIERNLDHNIHDALDDILGSIQGDLTIRSIKTNLIPSFDVEGSGLISALQDIRFDEFGSSIDAFKLCTFLDIDTDTFVPREAVKVYAKVDKYVEVSKADLKNANYVAPDGVELFYSGAYDSTPNDEDHTLDAMAQKELRYAYDSKKNEYYVDNSCYGNDFNADETETKFFRHYIYEQYSAGGQYAQNEEFFVKGYGNRVTTFSNEGAGTFELYFKGYVSLKNLYVFEAGNYVSLNDKVNAPTINAYQSFYVNNEDAKVEAEEYTIKDATLKKSSKLVPNDFAGTRAKYYRVHEGKSSSLMQSFAYLSIAELQDMDDFVNNITIGDVITVEESSSAILKALKDTALGDIDEKIDTLRINEVIDIDDDSSLLMKSLKARGCTIEELDTVVDDMLLTEVIDIVFDKYSENAGGTYVFIESTDPQNRVLYNEDLHGNMQRYSRSGDAAPYTYTEDAEGAYVTNGYYVKYDSSDPAHAGLQRYNKVPVDDVSSLIMQALALRGCKINELGNVTDDLCLYEIVDMTDDDVSLLMKSLAKKDCKMTELGSVVDTLEIGEVIEIDGGSSLIMQSLANHHTRLEDMATAVDDLTIDEVIEIDDGSSTMMKSLKAKGCKISELGDKIDKLTLKEMIDIDENSTRLLKSLQDETLLTLGDAIEALTLEQIIDIYENAQVELFDGVEDPLEEYAYLVAQNESDTEDFYAKYDSTNPAHAGLTRYNYNSTTKKYEENPTGKYIKEVRPITYVKDADGKYIKSPVKFVEINPATDCFDTPSGTYEWTPAAGLTALEFKDKTDSGNMYYLRGGKYYQNIPFCTYVYASGTPAQKANLYYRADGTGSESYTQYLPNPGLTFYVKTLEGYVAYSYTNAAQSEMTIYKLLNTDVEGDYKYYVRMDEYQNIQVEWDGAKYVMGSGSKLSTATRYAKQYCEDVYVKDANGAYVYIDGAYQAYDSENEAHLGKDRFNVTTAFLATEAQADGIAGAQHVHYLNQKSAPVIRLMQKRNINDMGTVIGNAVIEELMDISPDNMFDNEEIRTAKINDLGTVMAKQMNGMTMGELLDWANVTSIDDDVKSIIQDATIIHFFESLSYDGVNLTVDLETLYYGK